MGEVVVGGREGGEGMLMMDTVGWGGEGGGEKEGGREGGLIHKDIENV